MCAFIFHTDQGLQFLRLSVLMRHSSFIDAILEQPNGKFQNKDGAISKVLTEYLGRFPRCSCEGPAAHHNGSTVHFTFVI